MIHIKLINSVSSKKYMGYIHTCTDTYMTVLGFPDIVICIWRSTFICRGFQFAKKKRDFITKPHNILSLARLLQYCHIAWLLKMRIVFSMYSWQQSCGTATAEWGSFKNHLKMVRIPRKSQGFFPCAKVM